LRLVQQGYKPLVGSLATFTVSALWHGFYPGYFFSFISFALVNAAVREVESYARPHVVTYDSEGKEIPKPSKKYYDIVLTIIVHMLLWYCSNPFKMLSMRNVFRSWGSIYFCWHLISASAVLFLTLFGKYIPRGSKRPKKDSANDSKNK